MSGFIRQMASDRFLLCIAVVASITRADTFWRYVVLGIAGIVFAFVRVPETRGRSLEQIQQQLGVGANQ